MITSGVSNWRGAAALYRRETSRFLKVYNQTLIAPVVTALLFLAVFSLAVGRRVNFQEGISFEIFMVSGLIIMTAMQNAFANSASSITMGKVLGTIIDYLIPPLSAGEIILSVVAASVTRGIIVGWLVAFAASCFIDYTVTYPWIALGYITLASAFMALAGLVTGVFSESFDQTSAVTSYIVTPLAFLSGTFYPVENLPAFFYHMSLHNPFFHMIDGFRYSITGVAEGDLFYGLCVLSGITVGLFIAVYVMLRSGYRIKA